MIYEHPLAYVLGLEGIALMRSFTGQHDRAFIERRFAEIRGLLDDEALAGAGVDVARVGTVEGYRVWAATYDGPNSAFDLDEPYIKEIIGPLPVGDALDAACGTGRIAALLGERGHRVIGVDSSPEMLVHARKRVPDAEFREGDLTGLPIPDDAVDLVVCSLALAHVEDLAPVMAEFARVLRPGGGLVIADIHPEGVARGVVPPVRLPDGRPGRVASHRHLVGDYLRAALPVGLRVVRCEEPTPPVADHTEKGEAPSIDVWELWPWSLAALAPEAAKAAAAGVPAMLIWHFQKD
ncbi:SAM-dependent methyltransferase [Spongiactinospora rosea]|uniref:SAM-dependent methyltransferase n=1 Tax=Spongiactinospora rosea TaxID=2248750 RepID=A0A366M6I6_9ACTN|nr:class I SAM-dependent methyltransferase [Spongiactinospora rosea]RBQ21868.1 SAM-dependent methyltransferase [Spongiactinospora rosea]